MRAFIIAVLLFSLLILGVIFNAIYINEASDHLRALVDGLPEAGSEGCAAAADELYREWRDRRDIIELSTDLRRLTEVDTLLSSLRVAAKSGDGPEYDKTRAVLGNLFSELRTFESLEFFDIF
ncbi:MAG: DUF4363 family protein [Clostridia bacterium]|nr:DUF4363 family protein [Clostridia bacterium]